MGSDQELALDLSMRTSSPARKSRIAGTARLCAWSFIAVVLLKCLYSPYQRHDANISDSSGFVRLSLLTSHLSLSAELLQQQSSRTGFVRGRIDWEPCLDNDKMYCTYLEVPMDVSFPTSQPIGPLRPTPHCHMHPVHEHFVWEDHVFVYAHAACFHQLVLRILRTSSYQPWRSRSKRECGRARIWLRPS